MGGSDNGSLHPTADAVDDGGTKIPLRVGVQSLALHPNNLLIGIGTDTAYEIYTWKGELVWRHKTEAVRAAGEVRSIDFSPVAPFVVTLTSSSVELIDYTKKRLVSRWGLPCKPEKRAAVKVQCHPHIPSLVYYSSQHLLFHASSGQSRMSQTCSFARSTPIALNRVHRSLQRRGEGSDDNGLLPLTTDKFTVFSMATFHPILPLALTSRKDHIFVWNTAFARGGKAVLLAAISTASIGTVRGYAFTHSGVVCATSSSSVLKHWTLGARKSEDVATTAVLDGLGWHRGRVVGVFDSVGSVTVTYPDIPRVAPVRCEEQNPPLQMHYAAGMLDSVKMGFVKGLLGPLMLLAIVCRVCCCSDPTSPSAAEKSFAKGQRGGDMLGIFLGVLTHLAVASLVVNLFVGGDYPAPLIPIGVIWCVVAIFSIFFMEMVLRGVVKIDSGEALWHSLPAVPGWRVMFWVVIMVFCITLNSPGVPIVYRWIDLGVTIVKFVILGVLARQVTWVREQIPLRARLPYGSERSSGSFDLICDKKMGEVVVTVLPSTWRPWMSQSYLTIFPAFRRLCISFLHALRASPNPCHFKGPQPSSLLPDDLCYEVLSFLAPKSSEWLDFLAARQEKQISLMTPFSGLADGT